MAKIISISDTKRMWKEFHILRIEFDNHDSGEALAKSTDPYYKVGDEVEYTKNERGGIKIQKDQTPYQNTSTSSYNTGASNDKSEQIARAVAFKGAVDLVSSDKLDITKISDFIDKYLPILTGETKPTTYKDHFEDKPKTEDLPF
mgnify:CR=1 FL=1|tara:strand:- start:1383 stop:1817 length:435 start_codon:yes stop_codon:yes gene_type:complete